MLIKRKSNTTEHWGRNSGPDDCDE